MAPRRKHIPVRTCVACGQKEGKRALMRVVRTPSGQVEVDPTGKRPGRGAYVCPRPSCWELALKKGRLDRALRCTIPAEARRALLEQATALLETASPSPAPQ